MKIILFEGIYAVRIYSYHEFVLKIVCVCNPLSPPPPGYGGICYVGEVFECSESGVDFCGHWPYHKPDAGCRMWNLRYC